MSTGYVVRFVAIMTIMVALVLSLLSQTWDTQIRINEAIFNKRAILSAVDGNLGKNAEGKEIKSKDLTDEEVVTLFEEKMEQTVLDMDGNELTPSDVQEKYGITGGKAENIDMAKEKKKDEKDRLLPLYTFNSANGKFYIFSVRGKGLWDEIWGSIAVKSDLNTIVGVAFDHKGETPGLGAEIKDNPSFPAKFVGKELYTGNGELVAVNVIKGGDEKNSHIVDAISGATVTSVGVGEMMQRGIRYYEPYINKLKMKK